MKYGFMCCMLAYALLFSSFDIVSYASTQEAGQSYVRLHDSLHNVAQVIVALSDWDENADSPVHRLKEYICEGNGVALHDDVAQVFEYASWMLRNKDNENDSVRGKQLRYAVRAVAKAFEHGFLAADNADLEELPMLSDDSMIVGAMPTRANTVVTNNLVIPNSTTNTVGIITKESLRFIHNSPGAGSNNTFVGVRAGKFFATGVGNSGFGTNALRNITTGLNNSAVGYQSLENNRVGSRNTALGYRSMLTNSAGSLNTAVGNNSLQLNESGSSNVAVGKGALQNNKAGSNNVSIGFESMLSSQSSSNIAIGYQAGSRITSGDNNIMIGNDGLVPDQNTIRIGSPIHEACYIQGIHGKSNNFVGAEAVSIDEDGKLGTRPSSRQFKHNINQMNADDSEMIYQLNPVTFVYNQDETAAKQYGLIAEEVDQVFPALVVRDKQNEPHGVRYDVLPVLLLNEVKKQKQAIENNEQITKQHHQDIKQLKQIVSNISRDKAHLLEDLPTASDDNTDNMQTRNTSVNGNLLLADSSGAVIGNILKNGVRFIHNSPGARSNNTFVGKRAGRFETTGGGNSGFGTNALRRLTTGLNNSAVGYQSLEENRGGNRNTAIGYRSMWKNEAGSENVAVGNDSLQQNLAGSFNVAIGKNALQKNSGGSSNVAIGYNALAKSVSGAGNIAIGYQALGNNDTAFNIAIGVQAGSVDGLGTGNIMIGNKGEFADSGVIRIGTLGHEKTFIAGISGAPVLGTQVVIDGSGQLGTLGSSRKFKHNINEMNADDSERIYQLNPVTFVYNQDETAAKQYGLIAEEVDAVFPALVVRDKQNEPYSVRYDVLPVLLLNEAKKQKQDITALQQIVQDLQEKVYNFMQN